MSGEVRVFAQYDHDFDEICDAVVVGSGPGGAVVAHELAAAGKDVVLIEEGPPFAREDFVLDGAMSMARTMREGGLRTTRGTIMPTMQANALGGGSLVNSAICVRAPAFTLDGWCEEFQLRRSTRADLDPHYLAIEDFLGIAPTPDDVQGARNLLFRDGCRALGYSSEPIARNVRGCRGSGECFTGCRSRAKQSTDISYVPAAVRAGARVLTSAQVQRLLPRGSRVGGVAGQIVRPFTGETSHRFRVHAKVVVLAAGCMATPVLLQKSGLTGGSGQVGENLQFHPGVAVMGVFPDATHPEFGATQGYQSLEFVEDGFKLETLWAPPGVFAVRLPGLGYELKKNLSLIPRAAIWDAIATCNRSKGRVRARRRGMDPVLDWRLDPKDLQVLAEGLWRLTEIFFAAGAERILPGVHRLPEEMRSLDEARVIRAHDFRVTDFTLAGNHVFSTTRMHGDAGAGVVDEDGRCHEIDNLYVADTGILPRSPSVNPMLTLMALAHRIALGIAARL
ncbi:MAG: GMC family oxidoreductase [Deltaproteobacteria bacterium]|nr:GMC family oxidoreductase [Deltaproteobacteria bacterium]